MFIVSLGYAALGLVLLLIVDGFLCAGRYNKNLILKIIAEEEANGKLQNAA